MTTSRKMMQARGIVGLLLVALVIWLLVSVYQKRFVDVVHVNVKADRAGLLLDPGAQVRAFGVRVGEVRGTRLEGAHVVLDIALDSDQTVHIPSGVKASIATTTVFGAKYVDLAVPVGAVKEPIKAGETIEAASTTVEVNDVFRSTIDLLTAVNPSELNRALRSVSTTLTGNGERLGELIADGDHYLAALNPSLDTLADDFKRSSAVLDTYADVLPSFVNTADHLSTTSKLLRERRADFHKLLVSAAKAADNAGGVLEVTEPVLVEVLRSVVPFSGLLYLYGPQLPCTVKLLSEHAEWTSKAFVSDVNGLQGYAGFLPGQQPYSFKENAPKLVTGVGPKCYAEPTFDRFYLPHIDFDDGTADIYSPTRGQATAASGGRPDLGRALFGTTGLAKVLDPEGKLTGGKP